MVEDPQWELAITETVYGFYRKLLRDSVQEPVPLPPDLHRISLGELDQHFPDSLARIRAWLKILDLAVTPAMLRQSLTPDIDPEIAETLLRYYARKKAGSAIDRDKADFVATFLYRHPRVPGQWDKHGYTLDGVVPIPPFEIALIEILAESELPQLSEEYVGLLGEFDSLRQELETYTTLEVLTDSGIVQKGRDLKQALGACFYHPGVLAAVAPYNAEVGKRLGELLRATTTQLKNFAEEVHRQGGDISSPIDGKVTVQHLAQIEDSEILKTEYAAAQEKFRRVSKVKRAVDLKKSQGNATASSEDSQGKIPSPPATMAEQGKPANVELAGLKPGMPAPHLPAEPAEPEGQAARLPEKFVGRPAPELPRFDGPPHASRGLPLRGFIGHAAAPEPAKVYDAQLEEGKLRSVEDSIRVFVRAADAKMRQVVPMRFFNLTLTVAEADACGADYWDEKSFRGEYARALSRIVALTARVSTELEELRQRQNSAHLWKPHASSLKFLTHASTAAVEQCSAVLALAAQRGLNEKINAMQESIQKLRTRLGSAEQMLAPLAAKNP